MVDASYDYTRSLLPPGNGTIHAMSGGGLQEGGAIGIDKFSYLKFENIEKSPEHYKKKLLLNFDETKDEERILTRELLISLFSRLDKIENPIKRLIDTKEGQGAKKDYADLTKYEFKIIISPPGKPNEIFRLDGELHNISVKPLTNVPVSLTSITKSALVPINEKETPSTNFLDLRVDFLNEFIKALNIKEKSSLTFIIKFERLPSTTPPQAMPRLIRIEPAANFVPLSKENFYKLINKQVGGNPIYSFIKIDETTPEPELEPKAANSGTDYLTLATAVVEEIKVLSKTIGPTIDKLKASAASLSSQKALTDRVSDLVKRFTTYTSDTTVGITKGNQVLLKELEDLKTAIDDDKKDFFDILQERLDNLKKIPAEIVILEKDITTALGLKPDDTTDQTPDGTTATATPDGTTATATPKQPGVKNREIVDVLGMTYALMIPVQPDDFDDLDREGLGDLKKLHHDFGLDYINYTPQQSKQLTNEKKADFVNSLDICKKVINSFKDDKCNKFRGIVSEIISNIVGNDKLPIVTAGATAIGITGATAIGITGATADGSTGATAKGVTGATADGVTGATADASPPNFETLAKSLESELTQIKKTYEDLVEKLYSEVEKITGVKEKEKYRKTIEDIGKKYTDTYFTAKNKDPLNTIIEDNVKAATDAQKETPPDAQKGGEAIKALNDLKTNLENANKEFNKLLSSTGSGEPGGSEKLGKGIKPKDAATCYFNGIIQMLNQIPEFVEAITTFDGTKFEPTQDAENELDFFTEKQISAKEEANKRAQGKIDAAKAANDAFKQDKTKTITYDTADRIEIKELETSFDAIKNKIAEKYKSDIQGKSADDIKKIIKLYLDIKKDPTKATPENKEIAEFYTQFNKLKTSIENKEKEAGSKFPGEWREDTGEREGSIKLAKISELEHDLQKKVGEVEGYKEILKSGKKVLFDKFIEPLNALKSIYTKLNSTDTNTKIEIDDDILRLLNYKPGEYLERVGGRLRQEDAKGLLTSVIFDLFQKEKKLKQIYNKLIFDIKDTIICDLDVDQKEVVVPQKLPDGSESETQINLILYTSIPDPPSDKQTIQTFINNYEVASNKTTDRCIDFPINTAKSINKIIIPKDNKYLFVNLGREYYNSTAKNQGIKENNITIEHEITIDDKKFIAVGVLIYDGNIGSGHYLFHTLKEGPDGKSISNVEYNDSNVFTINSTNPSAYNVNTKGLLFLYKRKEPMVGGERRLGLRGRSTPRTSRIAPEQSTGKRTLKARTTHAAQRENPSQEDFRVSSPSLAQTRRRHLKARTSQSRTERSRVSGRLPIRRVGGK